MNDLSRLDPARNGQDRLDLDIKSTLDTRAGKDLDHTSD
jgi:hypothetical protein|uniref:Uncharacterized protein n=1 Tax=Picea glauca TaxID=3330 RepID=A0A124GNY5_PICGL|nr:hypothetical protein ABT39_MTgene129 [Picea glauca]